MDNIFDFVVRQAEEGLRNANRSLQRQLEEEKAEGELAGEVSRGQAAAEAERLRALLSNPDFAGTPEEAAALSARIRDLEQIVRIPGSDAARLYEGLPFDLGVGMVGPGQAPSLKAIFGGGTIPLAQVETDVARRTAQAGRRTEMHQRLQLMDHETMNRLMLLENEHSFRRELELLAHKNNVSIKEMEQAFMSARDERARTHEREMRQLAHELNMDEERLKNSFVRSSMEWQALLDQINRQLTILEDPAKSTEQRAAAYSVLRRLRDIEPSLADIISDERLDASISAEDPKLRAALEGRYEADAQAGQQAAATIRLAQAQAAAIELGNASTAYDMAVNEPTKFHQRLRDAVEAGDYLLFNTYLNAIADPDNPLGKALQAAGLTPETLEQYQLQAQERYGLLTDSLRADASLRRAQADTAWLNLETSKELLPLQKEALRAQYELDAAEAYRKLARLDFENELNAIGSLLTLAETMPESFWDNVPRQVRAVMSDLGIDINALKGVSKLNDWLRQQPVRAEAFDRIAMFLRASPKDRELAVQGLLPLLEQAGLDTPAQAAYLSLLEGAWNMLDDERALQWAKLQAQLATAAQAATTGGLEGTDIKRIIDAMHSNQSALRQNIETYIGKMAAENCVIIVEGGQLGKPMWVNRKADDTPRASGAGPCREMFEEYESMTQQLVVMQNQSTQYVSLLDQLYGLGLTAMDTTFAEPVPTLNNTINIGGFDWKPEQINMMQDIITLSRTNEVAAREKADELRQALIDQGVHESIALTYLETLWNYLTQPAREE